MKTAVVCGSGFIGTHLVRRLKQDGYFVRALSRSPHNRPHSGFDYSDEYWCCDLRQPQPQFFEGVDFVYQMACEVGGLGYITDRDNDADMLRNSTQIDLAVLEACRFAKPVPKIFFASSACVYPAGKAAFAEEDAFPAQPSNAFAWQKLFAETLYRSYARKYDMDIRIGRLFNCYGKGMTWEGGREKVVAALCRKVAMADWRHDTVEVWGDGDQRRSFTHVDDAVEGICRLMAADYVAPLNIGPAASVSISDLYRTICAVAQKPVPFKYVKGPVGVPSICCDTTRLRQVLDWAPQITVAEGLKTTYPWVEQKVLAKQAMIA